jgi:tryptophanyl-tRNA synthetase
LHFKAQASIQGSACILRLRLPISVKISQSIVPVGKDIRVVIPLIRDLVFKIKSLYGQGFQYAAEFLKGPQLILQIFRSHRGIDIPGFGQVIRQIIEMGIVKDV